MSYHMRPSHVHYPVFGAAIYNEHDVLYSVFCKVLATLQTNYLIMASSLHSVGDRHCNGLQLQLLLPKPVIRYFPLLLLTM